MPLFKESGDSLDRKSLPLTPVKDDDPEFTVDEDLYAVKTYPGVSSERGQGRTLWKKAGSKVRQSQVDAVYADDDKKE